MICYVQPTGMLVFFAVVLFSCECVSRKARTQHAQSVRSDGTRYPTHAERLVASSWARQGWVCSLIPIAPPSFLAFQDFEGVRATAEAAAAEVTTQMQVQLASQPAAGEGTVGLAHARLSPWCLYTVLSDEAISVWAHT